MRTSKKFVRMPIAVAVMYTTVMALGWYINPYEYGAIKNVIYMIPILFTLSIASLYLLRTQKIPIITKITRLPKLFWLYVALIIYLIFSNILVFNDASQFGRLSDVSLLLVSTLLVGIAEEFTYRGYILNRLEKSIGLKKALFYSSVLFGLLHSVNFIAGPSVIATLVQVVLTTAIGYVFGVMYLKTGRNLLLVALVHGVYDFLVFNMSHLAEINNSDKKALLTIPALLFLWIYSVKISKKL